MIRFWDGFLSAVAALLTATIIGVPAWGAGLALRLFSALPANTQTVLLKKLLK